MAAVASKQKRMHWFNIWWCTRDNGILHNRIIPRLCCALRTRTHTHSPRNCIICRLICDFMLGFGSHSIPPGGLVFVLICLYPCMCEGERFRLYMPGRTYHCWPVSTPSRLSFLLQFVILSFHFRTSLRRCLLAVLGANNKICK